MSEKVEINIPSITVADLEKLANKIKQVTNSDKTEVSFEMIICSFFPTCWNNIQAEMSRQYTQGYMQGYKDKEAELRNCILDESDCYCE